MTDATDARPHELRVLGGAICHSRAGYAEGRGVLDALLFEMGCADATYHADENPSALAGRSAAVYSAGRRIAELFEVHPEVLGKHGLSTPVVLFSYLVGLVEHH